MNYIGFLFTFLGVIVLLWILVYFLLYWNPCLQNLQDLYCVCIETSPSDTKLKLSEQKSQGRQLSRLTLCQECFSSYKLYDSVRGLQYSFTSGFSSAPSIKRIYLYSAGSWHSPFPMFVQHRIKPLRFPSPAIIGFRFVRLGLVRNGLFLVVYFNRHMSNINMGQASDCRLLSLVLQKIKRLYTGADVVLIGDCLGAMRLLNWSTSEYACHENLPAIKALILESPLVEFYDIVPVENRFVHKSFYHIACTFMPHYRRRDDTRYSFLHHQCTVWSDLPVFLGYLKHDCTFKPSYLSCVRRLFPTNLTVYEADAPGVQHGDISLVPGYRQALQGFFTAYDL